MIEDYQMRKIVFIVICTIIALLIIYIVATRPELVGSVVLRIKLVFDVIMRQMQ
jgi:hypothetical protein